MSQRSARTSVALQVGVDSISRRISTAQDAIGRGHRRLGQCFGMTPEQRKLLRAWGLLDAGHAALDGLAVREPLPVAAASAGD